MFLKVKCKGIILVILITLIFQLASCSKGETIKIGFSGGLTGRSSELGVSGRNGAQLAVDEINRSGGIKGRKVELISKDDKDNPDSAVKADEELINLGVSVIIGHMVSGVMPNVMKLINSEDVLMISPTVSTVTLSDIDDNLIRVMPSNKTRIKTLAAYAYKSRGYNTAAIIYDSNNFLYTGDMFKYFKQFYEEIGGKVLYSESYASDKNTDFQSLAEKISDLNPDCVLISASSMDTAMFSQQLYKSGSRVKVLTGMWAMTDDLIENGGTSVEGIIIAGTFDRENKSPEFADFRRKYIKEFNQEPTFSSLYSYNAVKVFYEAAMKCSNISTGELRDKILEIQNYSGVQGQFNINKYGDAEEDYMIFTVKDGRFEKVN